MLPIFQLDLLWAFSIIRNCVGTFCSTYNLNTSSKCWWKLIKFYCTKETKHALAPSGDKRIPSLWIMTVKYRTSNHVTNGFLLYIIEVKLESTFLLTREFIYFMFSFLKITHIHLRLCRKCHECVLVSQGCFTQKRKLTGKIFHVNDEFWRHRPPFAPLVYR